VVAEQATRDAPAQHISFSEASPVCQSPGSRLAAEVEATRTSANTPRPTGSGWAAFSSPVPGSPTSHPVFRPGLVTVRAVSELLLTNHTLRRLENRLFMTKQEAPARVLDFAWGGE